MSARNPNEQVHRQRLILAVQMPARPNTTAEMPTEKATIPMRFVMESRLSLERLESEAGDTFAGVRLVVRNSSLLLS